MTFPQNREISPSEENQSRGSASQPPISALAASPVVDSLAHVVRIDETDARSPPPPARAMRRGSDVGVTVAPRPIDGEVDGVDCTAVRRSSREHPSLGDRAPPRDVGPDDRP